MTKQPETTLKKRRTIIAIVSFVLLFVVLLAMEISTQNIATSSPIANYVIFYSFYNVNFILLLVLFYLVIRNLVKLYFERQRRVPGAKFRTKLIVSFFLLTIIPSVLLFLFARVLIAQTIEYWFSAPIEQSLKGAIDVSDQYKKTRLEKSEHFSSLIGKTLIRRNLLAPRNNSHLKNYLNAKLREYDLDSIFIYNDKGNEIIHIDTGKKGEPKPDKKLIAQTLTGKKYTKAESDVEDDSIFGTFTMKEGQNKTIGVVAVGYYLPKSTSQDIRSVALAFKDYRQKEIFKKPIMDNYIAMFAIVTVLVIFAAMWFGFQLAKEITVPIQQLAEGTHEVAEGNLDFHIDIKVKDRSQDEIGILVDSFNKMTHDLKIHKLELEDKNMSLENTNRELDRRRSYIETVLETVSTGVISLDAWGKITTINDAAEDMLQIRGEDYAGKHYQQAFAKTQLEPLKKVINELEETRDRSIRQEINLNISGEVFTLMTNIRELYDGNGTLMGMVMVLDNVTELVRAQRVAAWREVARMIAHEIKNPLTPIKLSAQRLKKRYFQKISGDDAVFEECVDTIIQEVDDLKGMINEFSNFARMPVFDPVDTNIENVINETISLYKTSMKDVKIDLVSSGEMPSLKLDPDQIKRVFINLVDNAIEAMGGNGEIKVALEYLKDLQTVKIEFSDNGAGIAPNIKEKMFMPYFSTKKKGTGLGLAIVNTIISEHRGYIRVKDNKPRGTTFVIELPVRVA